MKIMRREIMNHLSGGKEKSLFYNSYFDTFNLLSLPCLIVPVLLSLVLLVLTVVPLVLSVVPLVLTVVPLVLKAGSINLYVLTYLFHLLIVLKLSLSLLI